MVLNSLNFCLSEKHLIFPSDLNKSLAGYIFLVVGSSFSSLGTYHAIPFWPVDVLWRNMLITLMGFPLYVICHVSFVVFNNLFLSLIFVSLITVCLDVFLLGFILPGALCASWTWFTLSFRMLGEFSAIMSSNICSGPFSLSSSVLCVCLVAQLCPTLCDLMDCSPLGSFVHWDSPGKNTRVGCHVLLQGIFPPRGQTLVSHIAADSLPSEPPGKPFWGVYNVNICGFNVVPDVHYALFIFFHSFFYILFSIC